MQQDIKQIAHEIKNQLSIIDIYTCVFEKRAQEGIDIEPVKNSIKAIKSCLEELKNFNSAALPVSNPIVPPGTPLVNLVKKDLKTLLEKTVNTYQNVLKEKNNKLKIESRGDGFCAFVDENKFLFTAGNIIKNANEATKDDEIIIMISKDIKDENKIKIDFINHGEKIEKENQKRIFTDGFSTKKDGWGIGLKGCFENVKSQNGNFELSKSDDIETIFTITMPCA